MTSEVMVGMQGARYHRPMSMAFGERLREWRHVRRFSQARLAEDAEVSTRHLSYLENGRAKPSRQMVLVLASALELPLRERNDWLTAAGFAPAYARTPLSEAAMAPLRQAVERTLEHHDPHPAVVVDSSYDVQLINQGMQRLIAHFVLEPGPEVLSNLMVATFHPEGVRPFIVDWEPLAGLFIERLHREARLPGGERRAELLERVLAYPGVPESFATPDPSRILSPFVALHLKRGDLELRFFTFICAVGTPIDVTAEELSIELYHPMDDATGRWLRA
jgi:transcriptional regulator with XRE-family HTH domain